MVTIDILGILRLRRRMRSDCQDDKWVKGIANRGDLWQFWQSWQLLFRIGPVCSSRLGFPQLLVLKDSSVFCI